MVPCELFVSITCRWRCRQDAAVTAAGFAVNDDEPLDGYGRVYVADPFGNRIELMQPTS